MAGIHGDRRVEHEILRAFLCDIIRISFAVSGHVKVWNGKTVGADGTDKLGGGRSRRYIAAGSTPLTYLS